MIGLAEFVWHKVSEVFQCSRLSLVRVRLFTEKISSTFFGISKMFALLSMLVCEVVRRLPVIVALPIKPPRGQVLQPVERRTSLAGLRSSVLFQKRRMLGRS